MSIKTVTISLTINNQKYGPIAVPDELMMIDFLHEYLGLTGSRLGCGQGICRACVVILDHVDGTSEEIQTCITGAYFFNGKKIRTVEGIAKTDSNGDVTQLSPIQQAFMDQFSFQCGYCTPGFVNAATVLVERLQRQPVALTELDETIVQALQDHICRCTGYVRYYQAVKQVILETPGLVREEAK